MLRVWRELHVPAPEAPLSSEMRYRYVTPQTCGRLICSSCSVFERDVRKCNLCGGPDAVVDRGRGNSTASVESHADVLPPSRRPALSFSVPFTV